MGSGLELYESRISQINIVEGAATIHFSHAYIIKSKGRPGRDSGTGWSQSARLILTEVKDCRSGQWSLPSTIAEGYLEVGGIKHEIIPLPFRRKVATRLYLLLSEGGELDLLGSRSCIELLGSPIFLEDFS